MVTEEKVSEKKVLLINLFLIQVYLVAASSFFLHLKKDNLWGLDDVFLSKLIMFTGIIVIGGSVFIIKEINFLAQKEQEAAINKVLLDQSWETVELLRMQRHDFLNQMQVIHGMIQMQKAGKAMEYIQEVSAGISTGTSVKDVGNPVVGALVAKKGFEAEQAGVKLYVDCQSPLDGIPVTFSNLARVIGNLLDNAIRAAAADVEAKGIVELEIYEDKHGYEISVHNTVGVIPDLIKDKIFKKGFTTKEGKGSHGYGLSIVKDLVEQHNGNIEFTSNLQNGTTFIVRFPKIDKEVVG